jgi:hypothetical protein
MLWITILPAVLVGALFEIFLGHRHDYTGHYAAGYGGTLGALMVWLKSLPPERFARFGAISIGPVCVACILLGVCTEATIFRIAKFDEIDFCNQSLGAVLAGIAVMAWSTGERPADATFDSGLITGVVFLSIGGCFAVA